MSVKLIKSGFAEIMEEADGYGEAARFYWICWMINLFSCYNCFSGSCCRYWKRLLFSFIHSVARNPSLAKQSFGYAILGFALTEAIALFAPMMAFLISFVF